MCAISQSAAVELHGITKRFPGVVANKDIEISVRPGTVHAVVGENGAGKSTLMKILYGVQRPDEGTITVNGTVVDLHSPTDAIDAGIGMVFQHFMLADNLTVLENVVLGAESLHGIGSAARKEIERLSKAYGLGVRAGTYVADLGVGARQRVEILKVLYRGAKILILDEPTAVLVPQEVDELFSNLAGLKAEGLTIIFISHKLDEVLRVADDITVIRRGTTVGTADPKSTTSRELAELMVGSELPTPQTQESTVTDRVLLELVDLTLRSGEGPALLDGIDLTVHAGEVVGIAGVEGNGQEELVEIIMGMADPDAGTVSFVGEDITDWNTRRIREAGVGYVPADRHRHGLLLEAPLWENRILGHQTERPNARGQLIGRRTTKDAGSATTARNESGWLIGRRTTKDAGSATTARNESGWLIDGKSAQADTERIVAKYDVRTPSIHVTAGSLSGGNQQKLIIGREMSHAPKVLVASHPTRGVDVGAQAAIWDHIREARREGLGVLLISADLDELIGLSDTIRVILRGRLVGEFDPEHVTAEDLGSAMTGAGEHTDETDEEEQA